MKELVTLVSVTLAFWTDSSRGLEFLVAGFGLALEQGFYIFYNFVYCRGEDGICSLNIPEMIAAGLPDQEILTAWLTDLHFEARFSFSNITTTTFCSHTLLREKKISAVNNG